MKAREVLGVDIGGTGMKAAIIDCKTGELLSERFRIDTPQPATPAAMAEVFKALIDHFNWKGKIGCGFPAVIDKGIALTAGNIDKSWIGTNAQELFSKAINQDVLVLNDADAAGIAEIKLGAGKKTKGVVLLLTIGTGIGSALFLDGKLVPNTEFGHTHFKGDVAERYAATSAKKRENLSWDVWGKRLNEYLAYMERLFVLDLIILSGGVSKPGKYEQFSQYLKPRSKMVRAMFFNNAGIIGAALAAR
ncbi:MAG: ROK family protein [Bacteroidota bacterium]